MPTRERRAVALLAAFFAKATVLPVLAQPTSRWELSPDQNPERLNRLYGQLATS